MKKEFEELRICGDEAISRLERVAEDLEEKLRQVYAHIQVLRTIDDLFSNLEKQDDELEDRQADIDDLHQQLLDEKERRVAAEMRLSELSKLSAGVAKKSSQDEMIKAMRSYLNVSRRKTLGKREAAKMVFMELFSSAKMELPEDISELLEHLDDEQAEAKVVNVTGNYNDVHDNGRVDMKE